MSTKIWRRNPNVVARRIGGDTILVPTGRDIVEQRCLFTLNDTGSFIWETLTRPSTAEQIHAALLREFEVTGDQAQADLDRFLVRLEEAGCIQEE
ncbi:MAG: PqqD family protein [Deltaproteobacteria bacterium]|nr:PqqD family protein [Deltaproteobacteria bacterium]